MLLSSIILLNFLLCINCQLHVEFHLLKSNQHEPNDEIFTLLCRALDIQYNESVNTNFQVSSYTIRKNIENSWSTVAEISNCSNISVHDSSLHHTEGRVSNDNDTFFKISLLRKDILRSNGYRCDAQVTLDDSLNITFTVTKVLHSEDTLKKLEKQGTVTTDKSKHTHRDIDSYLTDDTLDIELKKKGTEDMFLLFVKVFSSTMKELIHEIKRNTQPNSVKTNIVDGKFIEMYEMVTEKISHIENSMSKLQEHMRFQDSKLVNMSKKINIHSVENISWTENGEFWPSETYALLKPASGCPTVSEKTWFWHEGHKKFITESTSLRPNNDNHSNNTRLEQPIITREAGINVFNLHFCVKHNISGSGLFWPKGSYCIHYYKGCPKGFSEGNIYITEDKRYYPGKSFGYLPYISYGTVFYCCRADGNPNYPIILPRSSPFYLYRLGGRCQLVYGLRYIEEYIYLDTEDCGNEDKKNGLTPDTALDNINITLCYYEVDTLEI